MTTLTVHERRIFVLMLLCSYTLMVWHEQIKQSVELNDRAMPRLTWDRLVDWLEAGWITLWQHEDYTDGGMIYGVYKLTEVGRKHIIATCIGDPDNGGAR